MSETESFESVMTFARKIADCDFGEHPNDAVRAWCEIHDDGTCKECVSRVLDRLKAAHDREIRGVSQQQYDRGFRDGKQQQYHRGFEDGRHSMDAEHRAIATRLRALPLDGGSHENLSQIARAIWHSDWGWTKGACAALRDKLIDLMGGVSDEIYKNDDSCKTGGADDTCDSQCGGACVDSDGRDPGGAEGGRA